MFLLCVILLHVLTLCYSPSCLCTGIKDDLCDCFWPKTSSGVRRIFEKVGCIGANNGEGGHD